MLVLFSLLVLCYGKGLVDNPLVGDTITYLDGNNWQITGPSTLKGTVPGDLLTDLQNAKLISDPIYETNWLVNSSYWDANNWTYTINFNTFSANQVYLVFDGVKMASTVKVNNVTVRTTIDQFLRYVFPIKSLLNPVGSSNTLAVSFPGKNYAPSTEGRFMACTGGWDWAPYTDTKDVSGHMTMTKGIWKSVYLVGTSTATISHVVPQIFYQGTYPTTTLSDTNHGPFQVQVKVFFLSPTSGVTGTVTVAGSCSSASATTAVTLNAGESWVRLNLTASSTDVKLWWPAGWGAQTLYNLTVTFKPTSGNTISTSRQIGFRQFALVTGNDTDPSTLSGQEGSGSFTMRYKVNGGNVYSRGANMIPMEELEGRANADAFENLIQNVVGGGMNSLRIWGGGIFLYDAFYDAADAAGILIYHDMMYAQGSHGPTNSTT